MSDPSQPPDDFVGAFDTAAARLRAAVTDACKAKHRVIADFTAHNGKVHDFKPLGPGSRP